VREHHRRGMVVDGARDHLARVDAGLRERAAEHFLQREHAVLHVEEDHREHLVGARADVQLQVLLHRIGRVEHRALAQLLAHGAARQLEHRDELGALGAAAHALDRLEVFGARVQQPRKAAEALEQLLRQLQHVLSRHAGAQQQGQQLGVCQRGGAARDELFARAGVEREILERHETPG